MKIDSKISKSNKSVTSGKDRKQKKDLKPLGRGLFSKLLGSNPSDNVVPSMELSIREQIDAALLEVDFLGRELSLKKNMESLRRFREKVRQILKQFQGAFNNRHFVGEDQSGTVKQLHLSSVIDRELKVLTETLMGKQKPTIEIAASVDNIKGLLIDYLK
tara:strand:- start:861 stop:1340 length:480 start_codon:yes stop_codon:yes gene_type:complete